MLEIVVGKYKDVIQTVDLQTIQHAAQITTLRRTDESLRHKWFWPADHVLYTVEHGEAICYLGSLDTNPFLSHVHQAIHDFYWEWTYQPPHIEQIKNSPLTTRISLDQLHLQPPIPHMSHFDDVLKDIHRDHLPPEEYCFKFPTLNPNFNEDEQALVERFFGDSNNLAMLHEAGIPYTLIRLLNPEYVRATVAEGEGHARACMLYIFKGLSQCSAKETYLEYANGAFLAERKSQKPLQASLRQ